MDADTDVVVPVRHRIFGVVGDRPERIRALGYPVPGTYKEFAALTRIKDRSGTISAKERIKQLVAGQETVVRTARDVLSVAEKAGDQPTVDLLSARMQVHEQNAWMLRSLLEE